MTIYWDTNVTRQSKSLSVQDFVHEVGMLNAKKLSQMHYLHDLFINVYLNH